MRLILLAFVAPLLASGCSRSLGSQTPEGCKPPDKFSSDGVSFLQHFVVSTDSTYIQWRQRLRVDALLPAQVFQVQVDELCTRAAKSRAAEEGVPYDGAPAYVYKMGSQFVVDAAVPAGWQPMHVQDALFTSVGWLTR